MRKIFSFIWETLQVVVVALAVVLPIRYFLFQPFIVKGASMEPNFQEGNYLIIDEVSYRLRPPSRGEVIVFKYPHDPSQRYIKRIIGLPGETLVIAGGQIKVFDKAGQVLVLEENTYLPVDDVTAGDSSVKLQAGEYFVLGDNRQASSDSRIWGVLPQDHIIGRVAFRLWPLVSITAFASPTYTN